MCARYFEDVKSYESAELYLFVFGSFGWTKKVWVVGIFFPSHFSSLEQVAACEET